MISLLVASAVTLTAMQAGLDVPRKNFNDCLRSAHDAALAQKIAAPDYGAFILTTCAAQVDGLRSGLIGFDVKNGVRRTQASADAQAQIDDYIASAAEKYESRVAVAKPKKAPAPAAAAPAPTPAAAPKN